jgi:mannose/fructose/N-acetylgalactosamine-specific phosphotransferase system component IIC
MLMVAGIVMTGGVVMPDVVMPGVVGLVIPVIGTAAAPAMPVIALGAPPDGFVAVVVGPPVVCTAGIICAGSSEPQLAEAARQSVSAQVNVRGEGLNSLVDV